MSRMSRRDFVERFISDREMPPGLFWSGLTFLAVLLATQNIPGVEVVRLWIYYILFVKLNMLLEAYLGYATTGLAVVVLTLYYSSYMLFAVSRVFVVIVSVVSVITLSAAFAVGVGFNAESLNYHVCDIYDVAYGKYACKAVGDILPLGIVTDAGFVADAAMQGGKLGAAVVSNSSLVWSFMGSVVAVGRFWWAATVVLLVLIVWTFLSRRGR